MILYQINADFLQVTVNEIIQLKRSTKEHSTLRLCASLCESPTVAVGSIMQNSPLPFILEEQKNRIIRECGPTLTFRMYECCMMRRSSSLEYPVSVMLNPLCHCLINHFNLHALNPVFNPMSPSDNHTMNNTKHYFSNKFTVG